MPTLPEIQNPETIQDLFDLIEGSQTSRELEKNWNEKIAPIINRLTFVLGVAEFNSRVGVTDYSYPDLMLDGKSFNRLDVNDLADGWDYENRDYDDAENPFTKFMDRKLSEDEIRELIKVVYDNDLHYEKKIFCWMSSRDYCSW